MEEVPDEQYEEEVPAEPEEPVEPAEPAEPEPAKVCKPVKKNLKEKVQCACGRWMSQHTYKYQHKCKAQTVDECRALAPKVHEASAPAPPEAPEASESAPQVLPPAKPPKLKRAVQEKLPPPEKPIKQKSVIKKQARIEQESEQSSRADGAVHPLDVAPKEYQPQPLDIYQAMLLNRQEQARRHREAMLAPYQQMFSMRR